MNVPSPDLQRVIATLLVQTILHYEKAVDVLSQAIARLEEEQPSYEKG